MSLTPSLVGIRIRYPPFYRRDITLCDFVLFFHSYGHRSQLNTHLHRGKMKADWHAVALVGEDRYAEECNNYRILVWAIAVRNPVQFWTTVVRSRV